VCWWLTPIILATQEAEIRISIWSQPRQIVRRPYFKKPFIKIGLVKWLKVKALCSSPSTTEKKIGEIVYRDSVLCSYMFPIFLFLFFFFWDTVLPYIPGRTWLEFAVLLPQPLSAGIIYIHSAAFSFSVNLKLLWEARDVAQWWSTCLACVSSWIWSAAPKKEGREKWR
jgi:hypothetical protein